MFKSRMAKLEAATGSYFSMRKHRRSEVKADKAVREILAVLKLTYALGSMRMLIVT